MLDGGPPEIATDKLAVTCGLTLVSSHRSVVKSTNGSDKANGNIYRNVLIYCKLPSSIHTFKCIPSILHIYRPSISTSSPIGANKPTEPGNETICKPPKLPLVRISPFGNIHISTDEVLEL